MKLKVMVACEYSGRVRDACIDRGHDAWSCDLLPSEGVHNSQHLQCDLAEVLTDDWNMVISFPPCTHLASSGARWFAEKRADGRQQQGIDFFMSLVDWHRRTGKCLAIENPVGIMSSEYRKPDQIIQPWQFGHAETKATCLWLHGLPPLQPTGVVKPDYMRRPDGSYYRDKKGKRYSRIHFMSGRMSSEERSKWRSLTYEGIAEAMADQWCGVA